MARTSHHRAPGGWVIALDTGGTFTDLVGRNPQGDICRAKIPSDGTILATIVDVSDARIGIRPAAGITLPPGFLIGWRVVGSHARRVVAHDAGSVTLDGAFDGACDGACDDAPCVPGMPLRFAQDPHAIDAPRLGLHILTGTPLGAQLPAMELRLSTTRGTNALLEGRGARVGVLVSDGLSGVVEIGDQTRPDLFARVPIRGQPLAHAVRELPERSLRDGSTERAATLLDLQDHALELARDGSDTIVVSLAHALTNTREHEIVRELKHAGFSALSARQITAHPRLLTRTETACVHAQIAPILDAFVADATHSATADTRAFLFTSAAVLQSAEHLLARDTLYSGPAGGARAVVAIARHHNIAHAVGFDMGGTSADVSRTENGDVALRSESRINRRTIAAPSVAIDSVAAGGGSICRVRNGAFEVGPESAGANPGPACYGRGGPLTLTDVNLLAGRLAALDGALALDRSCAERALAALTAAHGVTPDAAICAFLEIADARMALAIESLCVRDAVDPRGHALVAFGGAGGQHACAIADRLGLDRIVFPCDAGFFSASGVLEAVPARFVSVPVLASLELAEESLAKGRDAAIAEATRLLETDGFEPESNAVEVALRLVGQDSSIRVPFGSSDVLKQRFRERFCALYGYPPPDRAIEIVSIEARVAASIAPTPQPCATAPAAPITPRSTRMLSHGSWCNAPIMARAALATGDTIDGPAILCAIGETVVIDGGWRAVVDPTGDLVATRLAPLKPRAHVAEQELFAARLESIAVAMGNVLERTALSPNIRDRLDFSCAVLDARGTLIQNAPHLPVHLGALGVCTRAVMQALPLREGDVAVTNHPAFGGSHLPDVTTIAPVCVDGKTVAFVAVRAHHAEIGGTRPGSFPPDATCLSEEGVVLSPFLAVHHGVFDEHACRGRFASGEHPSRNPAENLADLQAQIAATHYGVAQVAALARELGAAFATRCQGELDRARDALQRALARLDTTPRAARVELDDGSPVEIRARIVHTPEGTKLHLSFAGSAGVHPRNFNAPQAVSRAATLYALRLLVHEHVPMNEGMLEALELELPEGFLNPPFTIDPRHCPPVVAGNVETSQSVVAALVALFDLSAESQSTMNNTLFGNERYTVYETLGGGAGAGPHASGADAVHVHMSNTRLTDIDVLERHAPVLVRRFALRKGSGGAGTHRGGDGLVRSYEFLEPVSLSFFGSRRLRAPRGAHGGEDGARGVQHAIIDGHMHTLRDAVLSLELRQGDCFVVETPGGGGWGGGGWGGGGWGGGGWGAVSAAEPARED
jgi:5-oxoprolinase (ATP-hydrolysing)